MEAERSGHFVSDISPNGIDLIHAVQCALLRGRKPRPSGRADASAFPRNLQTKFNRRLTNSH